MILSLIRKQQDGHVIFISLIMVLVSLGFTVGYLQFVMSERFLHLKHVAEVQARLNSISAIGKYGSPFIKSPLFETDTTFGFGEDLKLMNGHSDSIKCRFVQNEITGEFDLESVGRGVAYYNGFGGEPIEAIHWTRVRYRPETFAEYMYFTNEELPGPVWYGSSVNFRGPDQLEGRVFSNSNITMNSACPSFVNGPNGELSVVETAGNFILNGCNPDGIFEGDYTENVEPVDWPPFEGHDKVRGVANWVYDASELITMAGPEPDTLLMTDLEFTATGFIVKQWKYVVPPYVAVQGNAFNQPIYLNTFVHPYESYYPHTYQSDEDPWLPASRASFSDGAYNNDEDWGHFEYPAYPMPTNPNAYHLYQVVSAHDGVIWIEGGQVRVHGIVRGRFTVATSGPTTYRMAHTVNNPHYAQPKLVEMKNSIWITGDLTYYDSELNGAVRQGSSNRLGLLSAGDIIVANTPENGAGNRRLGADVIINAAMIAMDASFTIQYWQNSTNDYWGLDVASRIKGDGAGLFYNSNISTGNNDIRGLVHIWGSVTQSNRGYLKRNTTGAYNIMNGIGYDKNYNYDYNMRDYPPPAWPENRNADGSRNLSIAAFGGFKP